MVPFMTHAHIIVKTAKCRQNVTPEVGWGRSQLPHGSIPPHAHTVRMLLIDPAAGPCTRWRPLTCIGPGLYISIINLRAADQYGRHIQPYLYINLYINQSAVEYGTSPDHASPGLMPQPAHNKPAQGAGVGWREVAWLGLSDTPPCTVRYRPLGSP